MTNEKASNEVSPDDPCPFLRALVHQALLKGDRVSVGEISSTIIGVAKAGDGSPDLPSAAIRAIALIAHGFEPLSVANTGLHGVRPDKLRNGPLDKRGAGSRILDSHAVVNEAELSRLAGFASDKRTTDGASEPGLNAAELTTMMDQNFSRAKGHRRRIDRQLMNAEWPVLLKVLGIEGPDGRYLSVADVTRLFVERTLPERVMDRLGLASSAVGGATA